MKAYKEDESKTCGTLDTFITANLETIAIRQRADWVH
jgi:hypothetical protein